MIASTRVARGIVFHSAQVHRSSSGERVRVRVKLERRAKGFYIGSAEISNISAGDIRCAAQAALQALGQAMNDEVAVALELEQVGTFEAFGRSTVVVSVTATVEAQTRVLMGFSPVGTSDPPTAAARAVLDATNRLLGVG